MLVVNQILTGFAFRFEDRKWNRGRNRLPKQVQTIVPSVPFPVFKSEGEPGTLFGRIKGWSALLLGGGTSVDIWPNPC